jgi:hypothetical protein
LRDWEADDEIRRADGKLMRSEGRYALTIVLFAIAGCHRTSNVREDVRVQVGGVPEHWRLEWRTPTKEVCRPETDEAATCPCSGFAYGEMGVLDLVRQRPGAADERLPLAPLFRLTDNPADSGLAAVARWPLLPSDADVRDSIERAEDARSRDSVRVMTFGDYDHDGRATEFALQVGALPCGHVEEVVIGVSASRPTLHVFTSIAHPERPLVLESRVWTALLHSNGSVTETDLECGDHGSETHNEVRLSTTRSGIEATRLVYDCAEGGKPRKLISTEPM